MQKVADERDDIRKTSAAIESFTGQRPRGWLGPGLTETWETPDILARKGTTMSATGCSTTSRCRAKTRGIARQRTVHPGMQRRCDDAHPAPQGEEYQDRAIDQFEQLYSDARDSARVMALVVHPYIMGAPHRLRYFAGRLSHMRARWASSSARGTDPRLVSGCAVRPHRRRSSSSAYARWQVP